MTQRPDFGFKCVIYRLCLLGFVNERPTYEAFAERSAAKQSSETGVLWTQDFRYGLKEGDKTVREISWTVRTFDDDH